MRIDTTVTPHTPGPQRARTEDATAIAAPAPGRPERAAPVGKEHGRGAEHRSDVATLRQWVNHPEQRTSIALPDLEVTGQHGQGFAKAVAAYRAVLAELPAPAVAPEPATPVTAPPVADPEPAVLTAPAPDPEPVVLAPPVLDVLVDGAIDAFAGDVPSDA